MWDPFGGWRLGFRVYVVDRVGGLGRLQRNCNGMDYLKREFLQAEVLPL